MYSGYVFEEMHDLKKFFSVCGVYFSLIASSDEVFNFDEIGLIKSFLGVL